MSEVTEITCKAVELDGIKTEAIVEFGPTLDEEDPYLTSEWENSIRSVPVQKKTRNDIVAQQMGQYLLKGYKMLATTCRVCDCILMEDRNRTKLCIGCQLDDESNLQTKDVIKSEKPPSIEAIALGKSGPRHPTEASSPSSTTNNESSVTCVVQGVDLTVELRCAVTSLKQKLASLACQLETITDHQDLVNCLTSMSTTISVLQKIKNI